MVDLLKAANPLSWKIAGGAALIGVCAGWYVHGVWDRAATSEQLQQKVGELEAANQIITDAAAAYSKLQGDSEVRVMELQKRIQLLTNRIPKEVVLYVDANPACDLSRGAVSLLNDARMLSHSAPISEAAGLSDDEKRAASSVSQRDEVASHADIAARYAELAKQHDELIENIDNQLKAGHVRQ